MHSRVVVAIVVEVIAGVGGVAAHEEVQQVVRGEFDGGLPLLTQRAPCPTQPSAPQIRTEGLENKENVQRQLVVVVVLLLLLLVVFVVVGSGSDGGSSRGGS